MGDILGPHLGDPSGTGLVEGRSCGFLQESLHGGTCALEQPGWAVTVPVTACGASHLPRNPRVELLSCLRMIPAPVDCVGRCS